MDRIRRLNGQLRAQPAIGMRTDLTRWQTYLTTSLPAKIATAAQTQKLCHHASSREKQHSGDWDVIVVGFGMAGACAALEAANGGRRVLLVDRTAGGGSTRRSGGVVYAGGGTNVQHASGHHDTVDAMKEYLQLEATHWPIDKIQSFCEQSAQNIAWLQQLGVDFCDPAKKDVVACTEIKTSYPLDDVTLYMSGNETSFPFNANQDARPFPRGHRAYGKSLTGYALFGPMEKSVLAHPRITVHAFSRVESLCAEDDKTVTGIEYLRLPETWHRDQLLLHSIGAQATFVDRSRDTTHGCAALENELFALFGELCTAWAPATILACGGFVFNSRLVETYCARYKELCPLGTLGDDGSGIRLAKQVNAAVGQMHRCSAWKFITPPVAFLRGVVVSADGTRICNEDLYGATLADMMIWRHQGKGFLIIDNAVANAANEEIDQSRMQPENALQARVLLKFSPKGSLAELSETLGLPHLRRTITEYNQGADRGTDAFNKARKYLSALVKEPFYAFDLSADNPLWPTPCMSLGGLQVDDKQRVVDENAATIPGLFAAGRAAVGIASNFYISGLSLADCLNSGRHAGTAAASARSRANK